MRSSSGKDHLGVTRLHLLHSSHSDRSVIVDVFGTPNLRTTLRKKSARPSLPRQHAVAALLRRCCSACSAQHRHRHGRRQLPARLRANRRCRR